MIRMASLTTSLLASASLLMFNAAVIDQAHRWAGEHSGLNARPALP